MSLVVTWPEGSKAGRARSTTQSTPASQPHQPRWS